ncbi:MBL fold metallo-hydrolase [bacterium]|nr:MBL fold metallo-hydrolase [bacterium]
MDNPEVIILGSASGKAETDRSHAAIALRRDKDVWLLDAGEGVTSSMLRHQIDPEQVRSIYITHLHPDHCVGIPMLLQYLHMSGYQGTINIYLPDGALDTFQKFLDQMYLIVGVINPRYYLKPLTEAHQIVSDISLTTHPTRHLQKWEKMELIGLETRAFSFRLTIGEKGVYYSGDIHSIADILPYLKEGDTLILESSHIDPDIILSELPGKGIRQVYLTHASTDMFADLEKLQFRANKFGLNIVVVEDGLKLAL